MIALFCLFLTLCASPLKSKSRLEAENAALRHQLIILRRMVRGRVRLTNGDRLFLILLYRWFPSALMSITIIRPETLVRWHRAGFRRYWRWKSCSLGGRPQIDADLRTLIRRVSVENPLWGAPRIHGELNWALMSLSQASPSIWSSRSRAQFSGSEAFAPMCSSADYITITSESRFSVHTPLVARLQEHRDALVLIPVLNYF
jgi:hypothetical protein